MSEKDPKSVRDALSIALEALPGSIEYNLLEMKTDVVRKHIVDFIKGFALARGVIFEDKDIIDEINLHLSELKNTAIARTRTPR